jgi:hypothetical protein
MRIKKLLSLLLATAVLAMVLTSVAYAGVRTDVDEWPIYARPLDSAGEWSAIPFYRPPDCVPDDFNLLLMFDIPDVFSCGPVTSVGFAVWKNGPTIDPAPIHGEFHGLGAVPVWFVHTDELLAAVFDDGVLTVPELEGLTSLRKGTASYYHETLNPIEGHHRPSNRIQAHGMLDDGGMRFWMQMVITRGVYFLNVRFK